MNRKRAGSCTSRLPRILFLSNAKSTFSISFRNGKSPDFMLVILNFQLSQWKLLNCFNSDPYLNISSNSELLLLFYIIFSFLFLKKVPEWRIVDPFSGNTFCYYLHLIYSSQKKKKCISQSIFFSLNCRTMSKQNPQSFLFTAILS